MTDNSIDAIVAHARKAQAAYEAKGLTPLCASPKAPMQRPMPFATSASPECLPSRPPTYCTFWTSRPNAHPAKSCGST